uniref:Uncharacterized protein n=1 Tax=Ciona savignyi TaxID=51511 RepID=H2ZJQ4_CIOSA
MTSSDPKPTKAVTPEPPSPREVVTSPTTPKVEKSQASKTLGRPVDEKKQPKKIAKSSKSKESSKSSTLPRHFKSSSPWDRDERERREQAIQEELNFLRDEEIGELTERGDSLNSFEKDRLKNLLKERDFQMRVQEEKSRLFSDEDLSGEDYEIPDRPDRDRIIQLEDVKAQRDAANKEKLDDSNLQTPKSQPMNQHNLPTPPPISQQEFPDPPPMSQHEFPEPPPLSQPNFPDPPPLGHDDFPKPPIMSQHDFPEPPSMTQHNFGKSSPATQQNLTGSSPLPPPPEDIKPESKYSSAFSPAYSSQRTTQYRSFKNRPGPRPISDGYLLSSSIAHDLHDESPQPTTPKTFNHAPVNFITSNTPGVIGSQEFYNDPRSKRENTLRKEQATKLRGPDPSRMTFKDRQRLFQADRSSPVNKPRSSRKLMEIEQKLRGEMHNDYSVK